MKLSRRVLIAVGALMATALLISYLKSPPFALDEKAVARSDQFTRAGSRIAAKQSIDTDDRVSADQPTSSVEHGNSKDNPTERSVLRSSYHMSPKLPDEVAFWAVLQNVGFLSSTGADSGVGWIRTEMRLSPSDAELFLGQLRNTAAGYNEQYRDVTKDVACSANDERADRTELYSVLERLDDLTYEMAGKYLMQFYAEIGLEYTKRFEVALQNRKQEISHSTFRQQVIHEENGIDPAETLAKICDLLSSEKRSE